MPKVPSPPRDPSPGLGTILSSPVALPDVVPSPRPRGPSHCCGTAVPWLGAPRLGAAAWGLPGAPSQRPAGGAGTGAGLAMGTRRSLMSFLDASGWAEAVLINLCLITGRKTDCMRYRSVGLGRRSEPPASALDSFAVRSRGFALYPHGSGREGATEERGAKGRGETGWRKVGTTKAGCAGAAEPGERPHLGTIHHK